MEGKRGEEKKGGKRGEGGGEGEIRELSSQGRHTYLSRTNSFTELASYTSLLSIGISPQGMFSTETRTEGPLLKWVHESDWLSEKGRESDSKSWRQGKEERIQGRGERGEEKEEILTQIGKKKVWQVERVDRDNEPIRVRFTSEQLRQKQSCCISVHHCASIVRGVLYIQCYIFYTEYNTIITLPHRYTFHRRGY